MALGLLLFGQAAALLGLERSSGAASTSVPAEFLPAYPVLLVLLVGYGAANILFWNRPLLLAQGLADYALKVSLWAMLVKVILALAVPAARGLPGRGRLPLGLFRRLGGRDGLARLGRSEPRGEKLE